MKKSVLKEYARLIAVKGLNVQKGQDVWINCDLDQPEFVQMVVEQCYKCGAREVRVEWSYQSLAKIHYRYGKVKDMGKIK
nr:aminopeptidase [Sphaerochaetaceae bacterium]